MSPPRSVPVIGLIGGIGSGKSSVARQLAARRRLAVIDADAIGHRVLQQDDVKDRLRQQFSAQIFGNTSQVDRAALAGLVFGDDPTSKTNRKHLEEIVHPVIAAEISETVSTLQASSTVEAIVLDAAILLEAGWRNVCDCVVFIEVPLETRQKRVADSRGWSPEDLKRRENSQLSLEEKRNQADFLINNDGDLEESSDELEKILNRLLV